MVECEQCKEPAVERVRQEPRGVDAWRCRECRDAKRWCPRCDQGWIRRYSLAGQSGTIYSCDECDATWSGVMEIRVPGQDLQTFLESRHAGLSSADLTLVRESEA